MYIFSNFQISYCSPQYFCKILHSERLQPLTCELCVHVPTRSPDRQRAGNELCSFVLCHVRMKSTRPKPNGHFSYSERQILFPQFTEAKYRAKQTNQSEPTYIPQSELYFRNQKMKKIANAAQACNILHGIIKNIPNVIKQSDHTTN